MSWLQRYLDYTQHQESPEEYHFWVGMTTIASVLNRRVHTDRRSHGVSWYQVFPGQMMCVLVGPPALGKGLPIRLGRKLMLLSNVDIMKGKGSAEKIIDNLEVISKNHNGDAIATIIAPELSVFLNKQVYSDALVDFLTDIYDAEDPFVYMTRSGGNKTLRNPCVTVLAGATPVTIGESIPEKAQSSGYLSRVLHIWADKCTKPTNPLTDLDDEEITQTEIDRIKCAEVELATDLLKMSQLTGAFKYTHAGKLWFNSWLDSFARSLQGHVEGARRRQDHLIRLSMILRISDAIRKHDVADPQLKMHTDGTLAAADIALSNMEAGLPFALSHIGRNPASRNYERIVELIRVKGGRITSDDLKRRMHQYYPNIEDLKMALRSLHEAKMIVYLGVDRTGAEWWSLSP